MLDLAKVTPPLFEFQSPDGSKKSFDAFDLQNSLEEKYAAASTGPLSRKGQDIVREVLGIPDLTPAQCAAVVAAHIEFMQELASVKKILGPSRS